MVCRTVKCNYKLKCHIILNKILRQTKKEKNILSTQKKVMHYFDGSSKAYPINLA